MAGRTLNTPILTLPYYLPPLVQNFVQMHSKPDRNLILHLTNKLPREGSAVEQQLDHSVIILAGRTGQIHKKVANIALGLALMKSIYEKIRLNSSDA